MNNERLDIAMAALRGIQDICDNCTSEAHSAVLYDIERTARSALNEIAREAALGEK